TPAASTKGIPSTGAAPGAQTAGKARQMAICEKCPATSIEIAFVRCRTDWLLPGTHTAKVPHRQWRWPWSPIGRAGNPIHPFNQSRDILMNQDMPDFSNVQSGSSSTATKIYEVVAGDSLSKIAKREYGDANKWERIYEANRDVLKNPDKIYPGQKLKIPPL
ncbi:MAG TPA: LysM peptidoglycan-binding domain-containing protein, partial [Caldilinea sp.]|nr:LysM peptidoglycan-binding domain-containing protein [Caldilinea sp.]